jgi:hypothetical protein
VTDERPFRCSAQSLALEEPMLGTASTIRRWLLLEQAGPWGPRALVDSRLPDGLGARLVRLSHRLGVRVVLIRRHGRGPRSTGPHCFLASSAPGPPWMEHVRLPRSEAVLDLDLTAFSRGRRLGLDPAPEPLYLVCTHGRHDPCCAERGRPVVRELAARFPESTWECSHVGGDRFAGNVVFLPDGLYFGRVGPGDAVGVVKAYADGEISLRHFRGRSSYGMAAQAAEVHLRTTRNLSPIDGVRLVDVRRDGDEVAARFVVPGGRAVVRLGVRSAQPARRLACHNRDVGEPPAYDLLGIDDEPA